MPKLKVMEDGALNAFATGLNEKQYSITVTTGLLDRARRRRDRGRARPRADPYPQRRRAHAGDRRDHRRRDLVLRRDGVPHAVPGRLALRAAAAPAASSDSGKGGGAGIAIVIAVALIAVAWLLSIVIRFALSRPREYPRRRRRGRTDQEPGRHDLGAAQDRGPRRTGRRDIRGDGDVRRQSALGLRRPVRHPSVDRQAASRRWCSLPAGTIPARSLCPRRTTRDETPDADEQPAPGPRPGPSRAKPFLPAEPPVTLGESTPPGAGSDGRPLGTAPS